MTSFDTVIDRALVIVNDYKLAKLYEKSVNDFKTYCDGHLMTAVSKFYQCRQSLTYNSTARTFDVDLTDLEITILSSFWVIGWWEQQLNNASQIELKLKTSSSFTFNSEAQNMKEKQSVIDKLYEQVKRLINDYEIMGITSL